MFQKFLYRSVYFDNIINISFFDILIFAAIVIVSVFLTIFLKKSINRRLQKNSKSGGFMLLIANSISILIWSAALMFTLSLVIVDFWKITLVDIKFIEINSLDLIIIVTLLIVAILFQNYVRLIWKNKKDNLKKYAETIFIWVLTSSIILRLILSDYSKINKFSIFKIKDVEINFSDLLYVISVIAIIWFLISLINKFFVRQTEKGVLDVGTGASLLKVSKYFVWIIGIISILQGIGFQLSILLAGSAALLIGFGMGIQQIFGDVASGFILLIERTLKVGDVVEVDGMLGKVVKSGIRTTIIVTRDNTRVIVPNSQFTSEKVINWSHMEALTRFHVDIGVAYGSDIELVIRALRECAFGHPKVKNEPESFVRFNNFGDSSLDFQLYFWTEFAFEAENIKSDLRVNIDKKFRETGISIPFPQRDIHIIKSL